MSVVHAAAVVAQTPLPSPQVVKELVTNNNTVPAQIPAAVVQAAQLAGMFVAAFVLSVAHRVVEYVTAKEKGWGPNVNRLLATGYSLGVALVGTATMHQLGTNLTQLVTLAVGSFTALTGSFWTYEVRKMFQGLVGLTPLGSSSAPAPDLATDQNPAEGVG